MSSGACSARRLSTPTESQERLPAQPRSALCALTSAMSPFSEAAWPQRQEFLTSMRRVPPERRRTSLTKPSRSDESPPGLAIVRTTAFSGLVPPARSDLECPHPLTSSAASAAVSEITPVGRKRAIVDVLDATVTRLGPRAY